MVGPRRSRTLAAGVLALGLLTAASGCGSALQPPAAKATAKTTTTTTSSAPTTTPTTTTSSSFSTAASSSGGTLGTEAQGRKLTLADFFNPDSNWQERRYDLADQKQVQGIGTTVGSCGTGSPKELELRLGNNFNQLAFSAAQANDSDNSSQNLVVQVIANNQQVEIRSIPFNQIQQFTISVAGVNALKIDLSLDDSIQGCGRGSVIGVITGATLT